MRKLRTASALLASAAALTLGGIGLAAPANADSASALTLAALAYPQDNFGGIPTVIVDDAQACTSITADSAQNLLATAGESITFYNTSTCSTGQTGDLSVTLSSGQSTSDFGFTAQSYTIA